MVLSCVPELGSHPGQLVIVDLFIKCEKVAALKVKAAGLRRQLKMMKGAVEDRVLLVDKIARIGGMIAAVRGELLTSLGFLEEDAIRGHCEMRYSLREAVSQLWRRTAKGLQKETMCMQVWVDRDVNKVVCDVTTYNQGVNEKMHSKIFDAEETAVPVDDDA